MILRQLYFSWQMSDAKDLSVVLLVSFIYVSSLLFAHSYFQLREAVDSSITKQQQEQIRVNDKHKVIFAVPGKDQSI